VSLRNRIVRLERKRGDMPLDCPGCGYPSKAERRILGLRDQEPQPTCKVCQRYIDYQGRPMHVPFIRVSNGERKFTRPVGYHH